MSFDPHGFSQDPQPPPPDNPTGFPDNTMRTGRGPEDPEIDRRDIRDRVMLPAIFLIIAGVLNLMWAAGTGIYGVMARNVSEAELRKQMLDTPNGPQQLDQFEKAGYTVGDIKRILETGSWSLSCGALVFTIPIVIGGIRMLQLKNYGFVIFASLLAGIPCLSGASCPCCGLGDLVAIWCLVVLLQPDVRSAFQ